MHFVSCTSYNIFFTTVEFKMTTISAKVQNPISQNARQCVYKLANMVDIRGMS